MISRKRLVINNCEMHIIGVLNALLVYNFGLTNAPVIVWL